MKVYMQTPNMFIKITTNVIHQKCIVIQIKQKTVTNKTNIFAAESVFFRRTMIQGGAMIS